MGEVCGGAASPPPPLPDHPRGVPTQPPISTQPGLYHHSSMCGVMSTQVFSDKGGRGLPMLHSKNSSLLTFTPGKPVTKARPLSGARHRFFSIFVDVENSSVDPPSEIFNFCMCIYTHTSKDMLARTWIKYGGTLSAPPPSKKICGYATALPDPSLCPRQLKICKRSLAGALHIDRNPHQSRPRTPCVVFGHRS